MTFVTQSGAPTRLDLAPKATGPEGLSPDQRRIARGLILHHSRRFGFTNRDFAAIFGLSLRTVQLDLANASALTAAARDLDAGDD